jgi:hypothetical protein
VATGVAFWKGLLWSYGGRNEFRKQIIKEPTQEQWFDSNPRQVFFRDAPLSSVPRHILDKPDGASEGSQHHNNY